MKGMFKKWEGGAKKHGGLGNSIVAQVEKWVEPVAEQVEKMEGGAEKHGGLGEAMVAQVHAWTAPSSSSSSQDESALKREAEEVTRREAEESALRREAEEVARREAIEEVARREAEEVARREAEEVARREAEELVARRGDEELAAKKQAQKPTFKKFMLDFLRKSEDVEDDVAFSTIAKLHESQEDNATLAQMLFNLKDPVINKEVISWFVVPAMGEGVVGDDVADDF